MVEAITRTLNENTRYQRTGGAFDVSIATSLALEGLLGQHPDNPVNPAPILKTNELWINISTVLRNAYNSVSSDNDDTTAEDLFYILHSELLYIKAKFQDTHPALNVRFYVFDDKTISSKYKNLRLRQANTTRQKVYAGLIGRTLTFAINNMPDVQLENLSHMRVSGSRSVVILTHRVIDLIECVVSGDASLLESHTGKIKKKAVWTTKLSCPYEHMPFNLFTLQLFGDTGNTIQPMSIRHRKAVLAFAEKERWTVVTTMDRIRYAVNSIPDKTLKEELLPLFK